MEKRLTRFVKIYLTVALVLCVSAGLSGCRKTRPVPVPTLVTPAPVDFPDPAPVVMDPVEWQVITTANASEKLQALPERGLSPVYFGLDEQAFENLAVNMAKIRSYIAQQQSLIEKYRVYYKAPKPPANTEIESAPAPVAPAENKTTTVQEKPSGLSRFLKMFGVR